GDRLQVTGYRLQGTAGELQNGHGRESGAAWAVASPWAATRSRSASPAIRRIQAVSFRSRIELTAITRCHPDGSPGDLRDLAGAKRGGRDEQAPQALEVNSKRAYGSGQATRRRRSPALASLP